MSYDFYKRLIDIVFSLIAILFIFPLLAGIALSILIVLGRPVLFRQLRPGKAGIPFVMYKFRSMHATRDPSGALLPDADRLSGFGGFLRSTSLDELPAFWNVLKGNMSLVGPRPLLTEYLPLYNPGQARRHEVRPGITGWAQVNGRNAISWDQKFQLDVWYVDHRSLWLDIKILWVTLKKVLMRDGINAEGEATMPRFTGNNGQEQQG